MAMLRHASFFYFLALFMAVCGLFAGGSMAQMSHMLSGDVLKTGQNISNPLYTLVMQPDCNLVLYSNPPSNAVWVTQTNGKGSECELRLKTDGNLAIFDKDEKLIWETGTNGTVGHYVLLLQRDRNLVVYSVPAWDSGTGTVLSAATN
ncbi:hypothetical protein M5K25_013733 [Dendrobium thyrsiflorum]|uniref:Bulb-type lectin domain-containing protein n=1 Tax=Dendrobium thyrsiflorum TaxID=117978 RepID=A0ABD0UTW1_DENTH